MISIACLVMTLGLVSTSPIVLAEQTTGEKVEKEARDAKLKVQKGLHRAEEAVCMEGDLECAAEKAKNRASEAGKKVINKAKDVKDRVD